MVLRVLSYILLASSVNEVRVYFVLGIQNMPSKAALAAMAASKKAGPEPLPKASKVELLRKASKRVEEEEAHCAVFDKKVSDLVPRFEEGGEL